MSLIRLRSLSDNNLTSGSKLAIHVQDQTDGPELYAMLVRISIIQFFGPS